MASTRTQKGPPGRTANYFELGKFGRKTGIAVPERERDPDNGMENVDDLFSPDKPAEPSAKGKARKINGTLNKINATLLSEDMDIGDSTIPEPAQVIATRSHVLIPKSKSPIKTYLGTPAGRHRSMGPVSSPTRGDIKIMSGTREDKPVSRKLNFSKDNGNSPQLSPPTASARQRSKTTRDITARLSDGTRLSPRALRAPFEVPEPISDEPGDHGDDYRTIQDNDDDEPYFGQGDEIDGSADGQQSPEPVSPPRRGAGLSKKNVSTSAVKTGLGRPPTKRKDADRDRDPEEGSVEPPTKKRGRPPGSKTVRSESALPSERAKSSNAAAAKKSKRPRNSLAVDSSPLVVQRGPPRPKRHNGLHTLRRENPADNSVGQTRSGRNVIRPLNFWMGETIEHELEEIPDGKSCLYMPKMKTVVRAESLELAPSRRGKRSGKAKTKRAKEDSESERDDDLAEPWESEPGRVFGDIRMWNPEDPTGIESLEEEEELALSSAAIITRDIPAATFKFAKTLSRPFFGSGMVDLPPGAIKKPKSSRRMQMVFFVFTGRVSVTVNENTFRIGKGGMWQVPRGNFYSIENDYEKPARLFFSQGCDVSEE